LVLRERHPATGGYIPAANVPRYLRYRLASDYQFKTFTRGDGAQLSDVACTKSRCFAQKLSLNGGFMCKAKSLEMLKTYSRDAEAFVGHAGAGLL
jgi:hypothetical protein